LGNADWASIALVTFTAAIGVVALACGFQGWLIRRAYWPERTMLLIAGFALAYPSWIGDVAGMGLIAAAFIAHALRHGMSLMSPERRMKLERLLASEQRWLYSCSS
jgi:TRAP-type uncharacterized transport system fused permease subunit